jgi:hypothetical protein
MHKCRECFGKVQRNAKGKGRKTRKADLAAAQRALVLSQTGTPATDEEALWLLRGAAMMEGITMIELVHRMLDAYRGGAR